MSIISRGVHSLLRAARAQTKSQAVPFFQKQTYHSILTSSNKELREGGMSFLQAHAARGMAYVGTLVHQLPMQLYKGILAFIKAPFSTSKALYDGAKRGITKLFSRDTANIIREGAIKTGDDLAAYTTQLREQASARLTKQYEAFKKIDAKAADEWLQTATTDATRAITRKTNEFRTFLEKAGILSKQAANAEKSAASSVNVVG